VDPVSDPRIHTKRELEDDPLNAHLDSDWKRLLAAGGRWAEVRSRVPQGDDGEKAVLAKLQDRALEVCMRAHACEEERTRKSEVLLPLSFLSFK
jgi:hypothetical protein